MNAIISKLGPVDYLPTYEAMRDFTASRSEQTPDQLWLCEHPPTFTQGLAGRPGHVLAPGRIPVVPTNRGGQVTYHGPGQVVAYPLIDLKRARYFVKEFVYRVEEAVIRTLNFYGVAGHRMAGAPGIYVRLDDPRSHAVLARRRRARASNSHHDHPITSAIGVPAGIASPDFDGLGKIAALGIKVSRNCTYHGVAFNVAMDLEPFSRIDPCGYAGLQTVDLSSIGVSVGWSDAADLLGQKLVTHLAP